MQQNYEVKNIWGLYKGTHVEYVSVQKQVIQEIAFVGRREPRLYWQQKPQSSKTQDPRNNCKFTKRFDIVGMLNVFKIVND